MSGLLWKICCCPADWRYATDVFNACFVVTTMYVFSSYNPLCHNCMFEPDFEISNLQPHWKLNLNFAPVCITNMYDTIDGYEHSPARVNGEQQSLSPIKMMVALAPHAIDPTEWEDMSHTSRTQILAVIEDEANSLCRFPWSYINTMDRKHTMIEVEGIPSICGDFL